MTEPKPYHEVFDQFVGEISSYDLATDEATTAIKNFETFSKCRPQPVEPEPIPEPVPETAWEKFKCTTSRVWDNETTRVLIKAGGAFGGVVLVTWSTIHRDHVVERQALQQANQRPS